MSIQISGTTVIDNSRNLTNILSYNEPTNEAFAIYGGVNFAYDVANDIGTSSVSLNSFALSINKGNMLWLNNNYPLTLVAPSDSGVYQVVLQITNNTSAGAVTFSNFMSVTGDSLTTTDGDKFQLFIIKIYSTVNHCHIVAMQ